MPAQRLEDDDFSGGTDRIRYSIELGEAQGPFRVEAELCYQPIGYRWAMNLKHYDAEEPRKFMRYYEDRSLLLNSGAGTHARRVSVTVTITSKFHLVVIR